MKVEFLLWLAVAMAVFLSAATASRGFIATNNIWILILSLSLYCVGNLVMVRLMREGGLGLAISISAVAQLVLINIIAFFVFDERLTVSQMAGIALGLVSMALLLFPISAKA